MGEIATLQKMKPRMVTVMMLMGQTYHTTGASQHTQYPEGNRGVAKGPKTIL
jgi:hypothetical protein